MKTIELLSPAKNAETAIEAIKHGADAVYIGAPSHGARAAATNSVDDLRRVVDFAHRFNARVYVTLNTLVYDHETADVAALIRKLYTIGVDALIVQDMGILRMDIPPIALHASTQCDTRDASKARFLEDAGFSQIVVARELSAKEIKGISEATLVPIEAFVHGALCVCYSGDCRASLLTTGRSANRGECAQVCRYSFDLIDGDGKVLLRDKPLLSLRDMNRSDHLAEMIDAGVSSFKIEGRLKDTAYVKNITARYSRLLDGIAEGRGLSRASSGKVETTFEPDERRSFNRGFSGYFIDADKGRLTSGVGLMLAGTSKAVGTKVATVKGRRGNALVVNAEAELHNGDGLGYFDSEGRFCGFRLNRVENGYLLFPAAKVDIPAGTVLYRNADKEWNDMLARDTARRTIAVDLTLRHVPSADLLVVDAVDERGNEVTVSLMPQKEPETRPGSDNPARRDAALRKTGGTIYRVEKVDDRCGDLFLSLSEINTLRRMAVEALDRAQRATYRYDYRRSENRDSLCAEQLSYHDNVANHLAETFYRDHGAKKIAPAAEIDRRGVDRVMTTRYCLRREMGRCLLDPSGRQWKEPLTLRSAGTTFALTFDCAHCRMHLSHPTRK